MSIENAAAATTTSTTTTRLLLLLLIIINIIKIDHIKMSLILSFINQTRKPMFIALNIDKYYK